MSCARLLHFARVAGNAHEWRNSRGHVQVCLFKDGRAACKTATEAELMTQEVAKRIGRSMANAWQGSPLQLWKRKPRRKPAEPTTGREPQSPSLQRPALHLLLMLRAAPTCEDWLLQARSAARNRSDPVLEPPRLPPAVTSSVRGTVHISHSAVLKFEWFRVGGVAKAHEAPLRRTESPRAASCLQSRSSVEPAS